MSHGRFQKLTFPSNHSISVTNSLLNEFDSVRRYKSDIQPQRHLIMLILLWSNLAMAAYLGNRSHSDQHGILQLQTLVKRGSDGDISSIMASQNQALTSISGTTLPITGAVPSSTSIIRPNVSVQTTVLSSAVIHQSLATPTSTLVSSKIDSVLPTSGVATAPPVVIVSATSIRPLSVSVNTQTQTQALMLPSPIGMAAVSSSDLFTPISRNAPNTNQFPQRQNFYKPKNLSGLDSAKPIATNKFYENLLVGDGTDPVFSLPYSIWWSPLTANAPAGINVAHYDPNQYFYGRVVGNVAGYYGSPLGVVSFRFGATEFSSGTVMYVDTPTAMGANINVRNKLCRMTCPVVQGMGFITFSYFSATPKIYTQVQISSVGRSSGPGNSLKFQIALLDGKTWVLYVYPNLQVSQSTFNLQIIDNANLVASAKFTGYIQIAKVPLGSSPAALDSYSGIYATGVKLAGSVSGSSGSYSFQYSTAGNRVGATLLTYLLPHHVASLSHGSLSSLKLASQTRGMMTGCGGSVLTFTENSLPWNVGFLPYSSSGRSPSWSASEIQRITSAANIEAALDMSAQSNLDSIYFAGKVLQKFAYVCLTANLIIVNHQLMNSCLDNLKTAMSRFIRNQQIHPLAYDTVWKGVVSTAGLSDGSVQDFGNAGYNDHHFHYGYFVHTAAIIGYLDPSWATANKDWVNTIIRDVANPSTLDSFFPQFRSFDWFAGHSWSAGIHAVADGRDEESSSEGMKIAIHLISLDYNFYFGMKLWGHTIGDANMEARANLMLAVQKRAMNSYMLYSAGNDIEPSNFVPNFVSGILFENKIDHTTWFSPREECIEGIHMLPTTAVSAYMRNAQFVGQEWSAKLQSLIDSIGDGWRGILYLDYSIYSPSTAYSFFSGLAYNSAYLDGGMTLTWSLAYSAAFT